MTAAAAQRQVGGPGLGRCSALAVSVAVPLPSQVLAAATAPVSPALAMFRPSTQAFWGSLCPVATHSLKMVSPRKMPWRPQDLRLLRALPILCESSCPYPHFLLLTTIRIRVC